MEVIDKIKKVLEIRDCNILVEKEYKDKINIHSNKLLIIYSPNESSISISFHVEMKAEKAVLLTLHLQSELKDYINEFYILDSYMYDENFNYLTGENAHKNLEQFNKKNAIYNYIMNEEADMMIKYGKAFNA